MEGKKGGGENKKTAMAKMWRQDLRPCRENAFDKEEKSPEIFPTPVMGRETRA